MQIPQPGPQPLYFAPIALLFRHQSSLTQHAYHRRTPELADTTAASIHWPDPPPPA